MQVSFQIHVFVLEVFTWLGLVKFPTAFIISVAVSQLQYKKPPIRQVIAVKVPIERI